MKFSTLVLLVVLLFNQVQSSNKFLPHYNFLIQQEGTFLLQLIQQIDQQQEQQINQNDIKVEQQDNAVATQQEATQTEQQDDKSNQNVNQEAQADQSNQNQPTQQNEHQSGQPQNEESQNQPTQVPDPDSQMLEDSKFREQNNLAMAGDYKDTDKKQLYDSNNNPLYIPEQEESEQDYSTELAKSQPLFSDDMLNMNTIETYPSTSQEFIDLSELDNRTSSQFQQFNYEKMVSPEGDCMILYSDCNFEGYGKKLCYTNDDPMDVNYTIKSIYIPEGQSITFTFQEDLNQEVDSELVNQYFESQRCLTVGINLMIMPESVNVIGLKEPIQEYKEQTPMPGMN